MEDEPTQSSVIDVNIRLVDVLDFVGDSVRPIREGLHIRDAGHIVCLGFTEIDSSSNICALGYVLQSSNPGGKPHEVKLKLSVNDYKRWLCTCSCKAGNSHHCKHIMGCLMQISKFKTLEKITCTDSTQAWGVSKAEKTNLWAAKRIEELCCVKTPKKVECIDNELKTTLLRDAFDRLLKAAPESACNKHIAGRFSNPVQHRSSMNSSNSNQPSNFCTQYELGLILSNSTSFCDRITLNSPIVFGDQSHKVFYENNIVKTKSEIIQIALETSGQNNTSWKLYRSTRITASKCYGLFTYVKNSNADWDKKINQFLNPKAFENKHMRYGKMTEENAFLCYRSKKDTNIKKTGFIVDFDEPWLGASPDGIDITSNTVLEIKCPASGEDHDLQWVLENCNATKKYIKCAVDSNGKIVYSLHKKHSYYAQIQINMHVLRCKTGDFIVYSRKCNDFLMITVQYDNDFVEELIKTLRIIYFEKVLPKLVT